MKYYLIAGEASGDLHGSNLIRALKHLDASAEFRAWGGSQMEEQGASLVRHIRDLAFMGFVEVVANFRTILGLLSQAKSDILLHKPDALILIDYPGFNMRIAQFAKKHNIRVIWYISPQVWAWKASRVPRLKKIVDMMLVILPFEKAFYSKYNFDVHYVGHPLLDAIKNSEKDREFLSRNNLNENPTAFLPGSRKQEVKRMLPVMLQMAKKMPEKHFVIAGLENLGVDFYRGFNLPENVDLVLDETYSLLQHANAAVVTSGTATLETALFEVPEVVGYRGNIFSFWIARRLVDVPFISLVNLIAGRQLVPELIQSDWNAEKAKEELEKILIEGEERQNMKSGFKEVQGLLGGKGASKRAADLIYQRLSAD